MTQPYKLLKVEPDIAVTTIDDTTVSVTKTPVGVQQMIVQDLDYWRKLAIQNGERLQYAENQLKDLRVAADEARARFGKYKTRLDAANARLNELQLNLTAQAAEIAALRDQLAKQHVLATKVHQYRQSLLDGPIWEVFAELAVSPPSAGER